MSQARDASEPLASPLHYLGYRMRTLRRAKGMSQRELAGLAGVIPDQIGRIERADSARETAAAIAACDRALGAGGELIDLHRLIAEAHASATHRSTREPAPTTHGANVGQARDAGLNRLGQQSARVPRQLPAAIRDFAGRTADLLALDALLPVDATSAGSAHPGAVVISAIDGTAGIGKTTLAVHWAHRVRHRFPDGTLYANLRGYGPGQPTAANEVLDGFLRALGTAPGLIPVAMDERAALYRSLLDDRRVLVVLDNVNEPEQVRPLLPASAGCLALITSRSSMTGLVISQGAARLSLDLLPFDDAVILMRGIIGEARADAEPQAVADIIRACARLPLALRIAGARAASRPHLRLSDLRAELLDQHSRLDTLSSGGDEASAVRAVFAWSYRALPAARALVFRRIGLHPGVEIDVYAAAAVADTAPEQARRELEALAEVHMVEPTVPDRYRAHDLLRAYAYERAELEDGPIGCSEALSRLLGFYLHTADAADRAVVRRYRLCLDAAPPARHSLTFDSARQATAWFEAEYANLTAAIHHAAQAGLDTLAWQLPAALNGLFDRGGHRADWIAALKDGLNAARTLGERHGEQYMLFNLASALAELRQPERALEHARQSLEIAQQDSNRIAQAIALYYLGRAYLGAHQLDDAAACYHQSSDICRELDDAWTEAHALIGLGSVHKERGRLNAAITCHLQALEVFRRAGDQSHEGIVLRLLGDVHFAADRLDIAADYHTQALEIALQTGHRQSQAEALDRLGSDLDRRADHRSSREHWQHALEIFEQLGDPQAEDIRARLRT